MYIKEILAEAGATLDDVMMTNVYMADLKGDYDEMNRVYREYFGNSNMPGPRHGWDQSAGVRPESRSLLYRNRQFVTDLVC